MLSLAMTLIAMATLRPRSPIVLDVNCDAGESLSRALRMAERSPAATIRIRGTCTGTFTLSADAAVLEGGGAEDAILAAPESAPTAPVLDIRDAREVTIRRLGFRGGGGGVGLRYLRSPAGLVVDSEFENSEVGLAFTSSEDGRVVSSSFHDNEIGLSVDQRSGAHVAQSSFKDNQREGLSVFSYSTLTLVDSQVTGSGQAGIAARIVSSITVRNTSLSDNADVHLYASDRSVLNIVDGVSIGAAGDATLVAAQVDEDSSLSSGSVADFYGEIVASRRSFVQLGNVNVHGTLRAEMFSQVLLFQTQLDEPAVCMSGSDLTCTGQATAATVGCPSAASCITPAAPSGADD